MKKIALMELSLVFTTGMASAETLSFQGLVSGVSLGLRLEDSGGAFAFHSGDASLLVQAVVDTETSELTLANMTYSVAAGSTTSSGNFGTVLNPIPYTIEVSLSPFSSTIADFGTEVIQPNQTLFGQRVVNAFSDAPLEFTVSLNVGGETDSETIQINASNATPLFSSARFGIFDLGAFPNTLEFNEFGLLISVAGSRPPITLNAGGQQVVLENDEVSFFRNNMDDPVAFAAVPEPSATTLSILVLCGFLARRHR